MVYLSEYIYRVNTVSSFRDRVEACIRCQELLVLGHVAQLEMCLAADMYLTADQGVTSSIPVRSHTFVEIDHVIISMAILLPSADKRRVVVSYKLKYVHEVLGPRLLNFFHAQLS